MLQSSANRRYSRSSCCWNCKSPGHRAPECNQEKQLFCSYCLKDGTTSRNCDCRPYSRPITRFRFPPLADNDLRKYPECYRSYRARDQPIYIGVGDEHFRTYINTSQVQSSVGWLVCTKASLYYGIRREFKHTEEGITSEAIIPLKYGETTRTIRCRVTEKDPEIIVLGGDALQCFGFQLSLANSICLKHEGCPTFLHETVYDIPIALDTRKPRPPPKTPIQPKNPIDLSLGHIDCPESKLMSDDIHEIAKTSLVAPEFDPAQRQKESILEESQDVDNQATIDHIMALPEKELEDYLRLDGDLMEVENLLVK